MLLFLLLKYFSKKIYFFLENPLTKSRKCGIIYIQKTKTPRGHREALKELKKPEKEKQT